MFQISLSLCVFLPVFLHLSLTVLFTLLPSFTLAMRPGCSGEETCLLCAPSLSPVPFLPHPTGLKDRPLEKAHFVSEDDAAVAALGAGLLPRGTEWWNLEPIRGRESSSSLPALVTGFRLGLLLLLSQLTLPFIIYVQASFASQSCLSSPSCYSQLPAQAKPSHGPVLIPDLDSQ